MTDFEKLGLFYLGRNYDLGQKQGLDVPLLYDSKDLVTHAVCVGMTGSGKTGLCVSLLEEAAIDGIPAIVIDPKGDLGNLMLQFPNLSAEEFAPWVEEGVAPEQAAVKWKEGLARWGQDGKRIGKLSEAAEFTIYTPGSTAGVPVSVLKSFACPGESVMEDRETLRDRIQSTATALLSLAGIEGDPVQSREHILLATILDTAWKAGKDLDLAAMIQQVQSPPVLRVGVLELEAFYPAKERFGLAMALNNLVASSGFEMWMEGEPLDVGAMLYTATGKPRISIFSIAHLNDSERMFFVSLLLNQIVSWMRSQPGTTSLRALLYMDEIFGYFPPVKNPPSKTPLLTLLKQARAYGLGVVLATQNPVDLDYKGLSNAGTWFIGRLQTERDKQRVLEGLEGAAAGASAGFDRGRMEEILAGLGSRVFLMNNVHDDAPAIFETRWALTYLRGPMTKTQIKQVMGSKKVVVADQPTRTAAPPVREAMPQPVVGPGVEQLFLPVRNPLPKAESVVYEPVLLGAAQILFSDARRKVNQTREVVVSTPIQDGVVPVDWQQCEACEAVLEELEATPADGARFSELAAAGAQAKSYKVWEKEFATWLYSTQELTLFQSPTMKETSQPGESERDFRLHLQQRAREARDAGVARLRQKYASKIGTLQDRLHRAEQALEREQQQASSQKLDTALSIGASLLGAFLGGGRRGGIGTGARSMGRSYKEGQDVNRAAEDVERLREQLSVLERQLEDEIAALQSSIDPMTEELETISIRPRKTNITVRKVALLWRA
ncbi:MAG: DUF87 domain-containing protein [Acidobacteriia bacterium]|nr:DUF87 domain-containing protein [Terriglobia bacterium]